MRLRLALPAQLQALLHAEKIPLVRKVQLRCAVPYSMEGLVRRLLQQAGAQLLEVQHGHEVLFAFELAQASAESLRSQLDEACAGQLRWLAAAA